MPYTGYEYADFGNGTLPTSMTSGGYTRRPPATMLENYGLRSQGPDEDDAIIINASIDSRVVPENGSINKRMVRGRILSLTKAGTMVLGVSDEDERPIACMQVGSDADEFDVVGGPQTVNPAEFQDAAVAMKLDANLPFWILSAGCIFETSAFDANDAPALQPTTPLTSPHSLTNFDIGGILRVGTVYVDHIIGVVIEPPGPCSINSSIQSLRFQGDTIPRIRNGVLAQLRD
jgi:hypothetical protein